MQSNKLIEDYKKYRWFLTSTKKLVIGGKSAEQNDGLLKKLKQAKEDYIVMHTSSPGSPFTVILSPIKDVKSQDIEQTAIFTGCFSRDWRSQKKKSNIDIFKLSQLEKLKSFPAGRWLVKDKIEKKEVELKLVLTKQKSVLRAVPEGAAEKSQILLRLFPGKIDKSDLLPKFQVLLKQEFSQEELLSAIPAGGVSIIKK